MVKYFGFFLPSLDTPWVEGSISCYRTRTLCWSNCQILLGFMDFRQIPRCFVFLRQFIAPQFSGSAVWHRLQHWLWAGGSSLLCFLSVWRPESGIVVWHLKASRWQLFPELPTIHFPNTTRFSQLPWLLHWWQPGKHPQRVCCGILIRGFSPGR